MGTRKYCDQCGNTTSRLSVYSYGLRYQGPVNKGHFAGYAGQAQVVAAQQAGLPSTSEGSALENVELCDKCGGTWLERVRKLTQQSDPD